MGQLLSSGPQHWDTLPTLILGFLLTLYATGIFAFVGFVFPTHKLLQSKYYSIKNPTTLNKIGDGMGVKYFRFLLLFAFWGRKKNRKKYFNGTKKGLQNFIFQTKQSEFGHFAAFVVISIISIILLIKGYYLMVAFMTLINIIGNVYPIILQRLHRARIEKIGS